ncbi:hypothetical protein FOXB_14896, partial [Fusarium oxysporum f. sp. conglutinans Fo5176]
MDELRLKFDSPMPANPTPKVPSSWTRQWIKTAKTNPMWIIKIYPSGTRWASFGEVIVAELGSEEHPDRLTIFQSRPNLKKGSMFTGNEPTSPTKYETTSSDEQLQLVKEMGMIFSYLNHKDIWPKYCAVYEAIYDHMGDFDTWYSTQQGAGTTIPSLLKEWREYNRLVLDSMVHRARDTETWMYNNKEYFKYEESHAPSKICFQGFRVSSGCELSVVARLTY